MTLNLTDRHDGASLQSYDTNVPHLSAGNKCLCIFFKQVSFYDTFIKMCFLPPTTCIAECGFASPC